MTRKTLATPPFKVASALLRLTTERLAKELTEPSGSAPSWSDLQWAVARAAAAMQGTSALLAKRLRWAGPHSWQLFMAEQARHSMLRHSRIRSLLHRVDDALRRAQVGAVALKGSALGRLALYEPGERPMGDIDLLARSDDLASIEIALRTLDYAPAFSTRRHVVFQSSDRPILHRLGEHFDNPIRIEVHTKVAETLPVRELDITNRLLPAQTQPGLNDYRHSAALMLHLLLHAGGNMRSHTLRQVQIHDIAMLARRLGEKEWEVLLAAPCGDQRPWWLYPPLALAARYYAGFVPPEVLAQTRSACPRLLRAATDRQSLTDLSWSNLHIHAFPGIEWSRTPLDALRFVRSRVLPGRAALTELQAGVEHNFLIGGVPWYGISHGKRILRWIVSRPPRVQTMLSLRAALGSEDGVRQLE